MLALRIAMIAVAALEIWYFSGGFSLAFEILADPVGSRWFNLLFAFCEGVIAPLMALAAAGLCLAGKRLGLAAILLAVAWLSYMAGSIAFGIAVAIYGF
jgi:hypothetical protein